MKNRIAIIGDIHGELKKLENLYDKLIIKYPDINVYSTGDLIDRGPDSKGVIEFCIEHDIKAIRGNHDDILIQYIKSKPGAYNIHTNDGIGGRQTVKSYGLDPWLSETWYKYRDTIPIEHKGFLCALPLYKIVTVGDYKYFINHAGLSRYSWLDIQEEYKDESLEIDKLIDLASYEYENNLLWEHKKSNFADLTEHNIIQIVGHYPLQEPQITDECIMIDLGCGKGGRLGAIILPENEVIIVD